MDNYRLYKGAWVSCTPPHLTKLMDKSFIVDLLNRGGYLVKEIYDFDCQEKTSYWYIIKDSFENLTDLPNKTQKYIKKANGKFIIGRISKERLVQQGYDVIKAACDNYRVKCESPDKDNWIAGILNEDESYEYFGCIDRDTDILQAFAICKVYEDMVDCVTSKVNPEFLPKYYPMYGLYFERNKHYLSERKFKYVLSSARSLTEHSNIQSFLIEKLNFRKAYCRIKITYKWYVGLAVKILYPFRKLIKEPRIKALLNQEAMVRGEI